ncbi:hypothetical protein QAD02_023469 [Eretmocerus hayati]|uniref:Uncharacterized protein n=1 Tax=Eretmocerus hayati TaxID=131215 RepID=A0ACC2Q0U2_9HYME|nr:hypothetical protein QAD02_023469 [Eretmocerus hayati]
MLVSALVTVAMGRPEILQVGPLTNLQNSASASASATASTIPQQLPLLRLLPNGQLARDERIIDSLEASLDRAEAQRRAQALATENARELLGLGPLVSATSSAAASSSIANGRTLDALRLRLADNINNNNNNNNAERQNDEQLEQAAQLQQQQQLLRASPSLTSTRLAQSLASLSATGAASSSSRAQLLESPELSALRAQQIILAREPTRPLLLGNDGQILSAPLILL